VPLSDKPDWEYTTGLQDVAYGGSSRVRPITTTLQKRLALNDGRLVAEIVVTSRVSNGAQSRLIQQISVIASVTYCTDYRRIQNICVLASVSNRTYDGWIENVTVLTCMTDCGAAGSAFKKIQRCVGVGVACETLRCCAL